jgi:hypothetical protein
MIDDVLDPLELAVYGTVHDYVHPVTGKKGVVGLAPVIGMSPSTLQNKANPAERFAHLALLEARSIMLAAGDHRILHQLAADLGEACVPLPTNAFPADSDLIVAWAEWQGEVAQTVTALRDVVEARTITQAEVARVRQELIEDYERSLAMLDVLKGMAEPAGAA